MKSKILIITLILGLLAASCEYRQGDLPYDGPPVFDTVYIDEESVLEVDVRGNVSVTLPIDVKMLVDRYCVHPDDVFGDMYRPLLLAVLRENVVGFSNSFDRDCTEFKSSYEME